MTLQLRPLFGEPQVNDFLNGANKVAELLRSVSINTSKGTTWPEQLFVDPPKNELIENFNLYSGNTGIIYFLLQLAETTNDDTYLQDAISGAYFIINNWNNGSNIQPYGDIKKSHLCMISGIAGVSFVISLLAEKTNNQNFQEFAISLVEKIINESVIDEEESIYWTNDPGIVFDSGLILFLIKMAKTYNRPEWKSIAIKAGRYILKKAIVVDNTRLRWTHINPTYFGLPEDSIIPNFFYGTSGVAFTLTTLYEETNDEAFLEAAVQGANFLKSIATIKDDKVLIPHSLPHLENIHYLGLCHGATGTIRLFYKLYKVTNDESYKQWMEYMVNGIIATGAPELHSAGYWNTTCQCCGSAGLSNMFLGLWSEFREDQYLNYAKRVGKHLLSESIYDQQGAYWYQAWDRKSPEILTVKTGYYDGAAGNALELLHIYLAISGKFNVTRLPEDPYPQK